MQVIYTPEIPGIARTIQVTLDANETLGNHTGPVVFFVPTDPSNAEFADIQTRGLTIEAAPPVAADSTFANNPWTF